MDLDTAISEPEPLLDVRSLSVSFRTPRGEIEAVSDVSFALTEGEILGLVGESGSGKSVTCMALLRLLPERTAVISTDGVRLRGADLSRMSRRRLEDVRGNEVGFVFQDPTASLNPSLTVGDQIGEVIRRHRGVSRRAARRVALDLLERVGIPDPVKRLKARPHELSGGMCQRVMIAMALACGPKVLVADEPTTALDVTIQAQIIELLRDLARTSSMAVILVTHDLGVVAELCDRVVVMYAGQVVETAEVDVLFHAPKHPYSRALVRSVPRIGAGDLVSIPGSVPVAGQYPGGCRFAPRCALVTEECRVAEVPLLTVGHRHESRCLVTASEPS